MVHPLAGIHYNPHRRKGGVDIRPQFVAALDFASGFHDAPEGRVAVRWDRTGDGVVLDISLPKELSGCILLPNGYSFDDGVCWKPAVNGVYKTVKYSG